MLALLRANFCIFHTRKKSLDGELFVLRKRSNLVTRNLDMKLF